MAKDYFQALHASTDSRFWINNPTSEETRLALEHGAFGCTTNPAYCSRLIKNEPDFIRGAIDGAIMDSADLDALANEVYGICAKRLMLAFMPIYEGSQGKAGFVTMQSDPRYDQDTGFIISNINAYKMLSPNYMAKIPVIEGGIQAIEECVKLNVPICATEVFAIAQATLIARRYAKACAKYGNAPPMFITHISGIFDEYLQKTAARKNIAISPDVLRHAGISVARKEFKLLREAGYDVKMLGGGARGVHHFTELIGGPHITINWSTAKEIIDGDYDAGRITIGNAASGEAISELCEKLPAFKCAYDDDGLKAEEFAEYGPVQLFRNAFLAGWHELLAEIASRKAMFAL